MTSYFDPLPTEVHRTILSFMDISSLSALSSTQHPNESNIASLASDDTTWYTLVQRRFGIGCSHRRKQSKEGVVLVRRYGSSSSLDGTVIRSRKKRPMSYGGSTWKDAYRTLSSTMRIPETKLTSSTVFASPSRCRFQGGGNSQRVMYYRRGRDKTLTDYLGVWCLLNHAENCRTKTAKRRVGIDINSSGYIYSPERRYLEVKLCLQNTKSGYGCAAVDMSSIRFVTVNEEESLSSSCLECDDGACDVCMPSFRVVKYGPWAPKVLLRTRFDEDAHDSAEKDLTECLVLHPLEMIVLSIHLSCPSDMVYETDVLSTLSSIQVQVGPHMGWQRKQSEAGLATAHFLPEDLLWDYYCQLPGGCLSLIDRSRLIPAKHWKMVTTCSN